MAKISGSGTSFQFNYTWGTPVLHVTDKADIALGNVDNESSATIRSGNITGTIGGVANSTVTGGVSRANAAIDSSNRLVGSIYDGTIARTPGQMIDGRDRSVNAIDSSNRLVGSLYDGTITRTPGQMIDGRDRSVNAIDSSNRLVGSLYDGSVTRTPSQMIDGRDRAVGGLDTSGNLTTGIKSGSTTFSASEAINIRAGFDNLSTTPTLKVDNANSALKNSSIGINTSTGVISGIGTGTNSRVFNDVIGISLDTTTNVGRLTISGVGASNTTADITKSNLGLQYDDGATVGAQAGVNLTDSGGTSLGDVDVRNSDLDIDYSGTTVRIKKGTALINSAAAPDALKNTTIAINSSGVLTGIGTADIKVNNSKITTKADGTLNYDGTAAVAPTVDGMTGVANFQSRVTTGLTASGVLDTAVPVNKGGTGETSTNKFLNSDLGLTFTETGVTLTKAGDTDSSASTPDTLKNSTIAINSSGVLTGIGTADVKVNNSKITTRADGTLNYDGTAAATPDIASITDTGTTKSGASRANSGLDVSGNLTAGIKSGSTTFTAAEAINIRSGFDDLSGTPTLKVANANAGLKNSGISIAADGSLSGAGGGQVTAGGLGAETLELVSGGDKTVVITGNKISVTSGTDGWNTHVYTKDGYPAAQVSFIATQTNKPLMVGLNTDPTLNTSYSSIDYAWYLKSNGNITIYESGSQVSTHGTYAANDKFTVTYDGSAIRYYHNGDLERTVTVRITSNLHMDSSFHTTNSAIEKVQFSAISSNYWSDQGGRPTELTDGRITTALNSSGVIQTAIPVDKGGTGLTDFSDANYKNSNTTAAQVGLGNVTNESKATMFANPTFTGTVAGVSKSHVGLSNVANKRQVDEDLANAPTGILNSNVDADHVGLGNVTNESKATMFANPTFTGTVAGVSKSHVGLGNVTDGADITADSIKGLDFNSSGTGTVTFKGNRILVSGGSTNWATGWSSKDGYTKGCALKFSLNEANKRFMFGLSDNPTGTTSFTGIDYAWFIRGSTGEALIYESGTNRGTFVSSISAGDVFSVTYDGATIRYYHNGTLERSVTVAITNALFADGSGDDSTLNINNVSFMPLVSNVWSDQGGRPTELTDGRVSTALTSSGIVQTTIPVNKGGTGETNTNKFLNSDLGITLSGTTITLTKAGDTNSTDTVPSTLKNGTIAINSSGVITGIGTSDVKVNNSKITTKADGTLNYDGTTAVAPNINNIPDSGNTKTYAGYAGTALDSSGRLKTSIISGGTAVSVADLKDTKVRTFNAIDSSNRVIGNIFDGTTAFTPTELLKVRASFDDIGTTPILKAANAATSLRNSNISSANVTGALGYTPGTSNFSGSAADLTGNIDLSTQATGTLPASLGGTGITDFAVNAFRNDEITVDASGVLQGIGTTGAVVDNSVTGNSRTLTITTASAAYKTPTATAKGSDTNTTTYQVFVGTDSQPTYGALTYSGDSQEIRPKPFFVGAVQTGGFSAIRGSNFQVNMQGERRYYVNYGKSTAETGFLYVWIGAGISSSATTYSEVTNGFIGWTQVYSNTAIQGRTSNITDNLILDDWEILVPDTTKNIGTGHLWLWIEYYTSSLRKNDANLAIGLSDRTDSKLTIDRTTGASQTGTYAHSTLTATINT